jgi:hypothetical protein
MSFKYRTSRNASFNCAEWSTYSPVATGANEKTINGPLDHKHLEYIIRFENNVWSTADCFSNVRMGVGVYSEMFKQGTFIIDDPQFTNADIRVKGRDYLRKALETQINLPPTTNENANNTIRRILDRCNIDYNSATWDSSPLSLTYNPLDVQALQDISGWKALDFVMDAVNGSGDDYVFDQDSDGKPIIKKVLTDVEADWTAHFKFNIESLTKSENSKSQLQRMTMRQASFQVSPEVTIGNFTGTSTSNGTVSISYSAWADYNSTGSYITSGTVDSSQANAIFVRYETTGTLSETARTQTSLEFTMATASPYNISVYGCAPQVKTNTLYAEKGNAKNILNSNGSTYNRINPFVKNAPNMQSIVDSVMENNGDPKKFITLNMRANPLSELRDNWMIISKYDYTDDIYGVVTINEEWSNPGLKQSVTLKERGFDLGLFKWDRGILYDGDPIATRTVNLIKWDTGFIWDQDFGPNATGDPNTYATPVQFN